MKDTSTDPSTGLGARLSTSLVIFVIEGFNRYSVAALAGILDQEMPDLPLAFLQNRPRLGQEVRELATHHRQVVLAFSFMTPQLPQILTALENLDPLPDNVTLVAGGPHASGDPLGTLQLGFDVLVTGEGEVTFPELLRRIFAGEFYADVAGIAYLQEPGSGGAGEQRIEDRRSRIEDRGSKIVFDPPSSILYPLSSALRHPRSPAQITPRRPWVDLNAYPPFSLKHKKLAAIEITRGCPWACSFCQTPFFLGGRMRYRSVEQIVYWLRRAQEELGMRYARFISADCFCYGSADGRHPNLEPVERLLYEVSRLMGKENTFFGSFPSEVRPNSVSREGMALIGKYCANDNVVIGAQSGSPRMLEHIHRGHTIEEVFQAAEIIVASGLKCIVDFIFGLPGETPEDRELTLVAIQRLTEIGATINSHFFMPLPGTPLANTLPGAPDQETLLFLERLTSDRHELGRWKGRLKSLAAVEETRHR
jgi:B12-binding domain/radical SAM domain protein